ncbi:MAG TPA: hypothetical protein VGA63_15170 [Geopsychrobacteraceae bacterium]|jgi:hypothetical protein
MGHYLGVAREQQVSEEEIGAVQGMVMAVAAGRVNSQLRDAEQRLRDA